MPHPSLSDNEKRQLALAKWLVKRVVDKHSAEVTGHVLVHLAAAVHDIDLIEKDFSS